MDIPKNPWVTKEKVLEIFGVSESNLKQMMYVGNQLVGKLKKPTNGKFNLMEVADYILKRSPRGGKKPLRQAALKVKGFYSENTRDESVDIPLSIPNSEEGLEFALKRLQAVEVKLADKVHNSVGDPALFNEHLRNWNQILDSLRKIEVDALKVMEEKGDLIRVDDAKAFYDKGILPVKTRLMALPVQLSNILEGQDAATIQSVMKSHITKILSDISKAWEEEDEDE